ncbi:phenylacetate--CoA ligase family protein [Chitinophaga vietnamensis]|uniref:phenylacetate--CoA ligase family protein n=1 Tax=Chitinophaga vietnamensis TaxID=2593957 RepID=UPI00117859BE|nr:phenylacetate--CoA ligase family protein [Chitinophaga vietnamensis]
MSKQENIYKALPNFLQNGLVTLFDYLQYRKRHGGNYKKWYAWYFHARGLSPEALKARQWKLLQETVQDAREKSPYYKKILQGIPEKFSLEEFKQIPIQSKEDIRSNIDDIYTIPAAGAILSKTGGTTGKSLQVRYTHDDMQHRFALLDFFRADYGYALGDKVAWFSGKSLLTPRDEAKHRYWKYDWLYKIRYYSTMHISHHTIKHYIDDLNRFRPLFAVGFPSCMYEIAKWGLANNYPLKYRMRAIFPTAETIVESEKQVIEAYFGAFTVNQYASSEGAPFILECKNGNLHMELLSGYFEVLDADGKDAQEGELVVTSFTTHGTPLIRYAIKDRIRLSDAVCGCGNHNPLVAQIQGRINDFVYSEERGKINLGNLSNCVKKVQGVVKFQVIQDTKEAILVKVVKDKIYAEKDEQYFRHELRERLGERIRIDFSYVEDIPRENSGKYRIVKQNIVL